MTVELIFKTTSPRAIEWWNQTQAALEEGRARINSLIERWTAEYGPSDDSDSRSIWTYRGWNGATNIMGMVANKDEVSSPPTGWRFDKKEGVLVPALRSARGKELAAEMEAARGGVWRRDLAAIGVPDDVIGDTADNGYSRRRYQPGFDFDDDTQTLYQVWGTGLAEKECLEEQAKVPEVEWVEVKRSEWYAREEAKQSATADE